MIQRIACIALLVVISQYVFSQQTDSLAQSREAWVDSVYQSLTPEERIGQVFMIRAHSNKTAAFHQAVENDIVNHHVGGLCFFQGGPGRQAALINRYQKKSKVPLFVAIDGEWGIAMRLDSVEKFPRQMTLGAIQDDSLIYLMGKEVARQASRAGVHINFAPVADVNNNPMNPVINSRSFSEIPEVVARKTAMYMAGMQDAGVMACAKHFPGHGDTDKDSHKTLPTVNADTNEMDSLHLSPFRYLSEKGIGSMMIAHLHVPSLNTEKGTATTLNKSVVTDLLRKDMGFEGLIVTDALEMKGVADYYEEGELEVKALQAGNDILLLPTNMSKGVNAIKKALAEGRLDSADFAKRVKRILAAKYDYQAHQKQLIRTDSILDQINTKYTRGLIQNLYNASLTLVKNDSNILPLKTDVRQKYAVVNIGDKSENTFVKEARKFHQLDAYTLHARCDLATVKSLMQKLTDYEVVIVNVLGTKNSASRNYGIYQSSIQFIQLLSQEKEVVCNVFANPYSLDRFEDIDQLRALVVAYQDNDYSMRAAANALFGGVPINGQIPFSKSKKYPAGWGLELKKSRLGFVGEMQRKTGHINFQKVDSIVLEGLQNGAYPGCQVLIAKEGEVIYRKAFGHQTYLKKRAINNESIYDLASLTKILATTVSLMKLHDEDLFNPDKRVSYYLEDAKGTNKEYLVIRDILAHQGKLHPWIPFYNHTLTNKKPDTNLYRTSAAAGYEACVAHNLYMMESYNDSILKGIYASELKSRKRYLYSDLGMYLMKEIIEQQSERRLDEFCNEQFYFPLGLQHTAFNPLTRFPQDSIVPTERDNYFRHQLIHGHVHDQGAAMIGGVSGHAGLFANSTDIAILMQMLLQEGNYGGIQYIDSATVEDFTRQQFPLNDNRRGMGFDKPLENPEQGGPTCKYVSPDSYGHSGFTGTYVWTDPRYQLTYVFLSNRVYPSADNRKLISMNIRTRIQEHIYEVLELGQASQTVSENN